MSTNAYWFFLSLRSFANKDSDFDVSEELSNADSLSDDQDDSDFDEEEVKKKTRGRGRGKSTSSPAKPSVKPRASVTGWVHRYLYFCSSFCFPR